MVANAPRRRSGTALAAAMVLLLVAPSLAPVGSAQTPGFHSITVAQGDVEIRVNGQPTPFMVEGNILVSALVQNTGSAGISDVPIWMYLEGFQNIPGYCHRVRLEQAGSPGSSFTATWLFAVPANLPPGGYNVTVAANVDQPVGYQFQANCGSERSQIFTGANRVAYGYFVKNLTLGYEITDLAWCQGRFDITERNCVSAMIDSQSQPYNVTRHGNETDVFTHFMANVTRTGTLMDTTNYGSSTRARAFPYSLAFRINGLNVPLDTLLPSGDTPDGVGSWFSGNFSLVGKAGAYNLSVTLTEGWANGNVSTARRDAVVRYADAIPTIHASGLRTDPAFPYPAQQPEIATLVTFTNNGTAPVRFGVGWWVYLDESGRGDCANQTTGSGRTFFCKTFGNATVPPGVEFTRYVSWNVTSAPESAGATNYLSPGRHRLIAEADPANTTWELNESNNKVAVEFFVADETAPTFFPIAGNLAPRMTPVSTPDGTGLPYMQDRLGRIHPHQSFRLTSNLTDDDRANLVVVANFTSRDNTSHWVHHPMRFTEEGSRWDVIVHDFVNYGEGSRSNWSVHTLATDAFGNVNTSPSWNFVVEKWPIQTAPAGYVVVEDNPSFPTTPEGGSIGWGTSESPRYTIYVDKNMTGFGDQPNMTSNLGISVTTPSFETFSQGNGVGWNAQTNCVDTPTDDDGNPVGNLPDGSNEGGTTVRICEGYALFTTSIDKNLGGPGKWNVSLEITDFSGETRKINRTFWVLDELPTFHEAKMSAGLLQPGSGVTVNLTVSDDFELDSCRESGTACAHLNLTRRSDGKVFNLTLESPKALTDSSRYYYWFNQTLKYGRFERIDNGGEFDVRFEARDVNGNWNNTSLLSLNLQDTQSPRILPGAGPDRSAQEVGQDITFHAAIEDGTAVRAWVQILRGSEHFMPAVEMTELPDGNFTATLNISTEGSFTWSIYALDSRNNPSGTVSGPLRIEDNLGPRIDVRSPALVAGEHFAAARPFIELLVTDSDGVNPDSFEMLLDGEPVTLRDPVPAGDGLNGYIVVYNAPGRLFRHGDLVRVNFTAVELSQKALPSWRNFTFRVDDRAPTSTIASSTPSYRAAETHVLNVSLDTRFTLSASDEDGLPTQVDSIRFRIVGGGNPGAETVYTGPFRITDVPGVYTGPRVYQLQVWAEDSVGNVPQLPGGSTNYTSLLFYVDDIPPSLRPFGTLPQGRYVNATFDDRETGVERAVAWYRFNNDPYQPVNLEPRADSVWSTELPSGRKGDRLSYYLQAWDRVGNTETFGTADEPYYSGVVDNHIPSIRITSPVEGSIIRQVQDIQWEASDTDGDPLTFAVYHRLKSQTNLIELFRIESSNARKYPLDTTRFPDGEYVFRVVATDGSDASASETTLVIRNRGTAFGVVTPPPREVTPGGTVLLKVEVLKSGAQVEARVYRGIEFVDTYSMNDAGQDGDELPNDRVYSVRIPALPPGDYRVEFFSTYNEDGESKSSTITDGAVFTVALTPGYIFTRYAWIFAALGLLAVAGVGIAAFALRSGRWD